MDDGLSYLVGGTAIGSEHTYCRSSSQPCKLTSSVAWKSTSVVLRVKASSVRRSGSAEVSRKTCGRLVCEASRREKEIAPPSGMVTWWHMHT